MVCVCVCRCVCVCVIVRQRSVGNKAVSHSRISLRQGSSASFLISLA